MSERGGSLRPVPLCCDPLAAQCWRWNPSTIHHPGSNDARLPLLGELPFRWNRWSRWVYRRQRSWCEGTLGRGRCRRAPGSDCGRNRQPRDGMDRADPDPRHSCRSGSRIYCCRSHCIQNAFEPDRSCSQHSTRGHRRPYRRAARKLAVYRGRPIRLKLTSASHEARLPRDLLSWLAAS